MRSLIIDTNDAKLTADDQNWKQIRTTLIGAYLQETTSTDPAVRLLRKARTRDEFVAACRRVAALMANPYA